MKVKCELCGQMVDEDDAVPFSSTADTDEPCDFGCLDCLENLDSCEPA